MIDGFSKIGDIATARGFFDRLPLELKYVVTWTVMVGAYTSNGETEEAKKVFEEMEQRNCFVWSSMICGYFKNGYCEEALEAFFKMQTEGFEPIEVTIVLRYTANAESPFSFSTEWKNQTRNPMTLLFSLFSLLVHMVDSQGSFKNFLKNEGIWNKSRNQALWLLS